MISVSVYKQLSHIICYSQVRASAVFALGTLVDAGFDSCRSVEDEECDDDDNDKFRAEVSIIRSLLSVASDGSPLVRAEVAVGR
jgi:regulator-associated protein of mTOR